MIISGHDISEGASRQSVTGYDVLWALQELGMSHFADVLKPLHESKQYFCIRDCV